MFDCGETLSELVVFGCKLFLRSGSVFIDDFKCDAASIEDHYPLFVFEKVCDASAQLVEKIGECVAIRSIRPLVRIMERFVVGFEPVSDGVAIDSELVFICIIDKTVARLASDENSFDGCHGKHTPYGCGADFRIPKCTPGLTLGCTLISAVHDGDRARA